MTPGTPTPSLRALRAPATLVLALALTPLAACGEKKPKGDPGTEVPATPAASAAEHGLTEEQAKQVLATVGDTKITLGQFAERLGSQSPYLRARYNSVERRREFLDNMIKFELLALEAKRRGHDEREEVVRVREQRMVQQMMKELFDEQGVKLSDITDQEIQAYYDAHRVEFHKPAQVRASQIRLAAKPAALAVLAKARAARDDMQTFRALAKEHDTDPQTRERLGDLRFFSKDGGPDEPSVPKALREAAFALEKVGDLHPEVIESEDAFYVLKLTGKRDAMDRTLDDARRLIQNRLWREKREHAIEAFVAELRKKAKVEEDLALLDQVKVDLDAPIPEGGSEANDANPGWKPPAPPAPEAK